MSVKLLALAASIRADSHNKRLLNIAIAHAKAAGADVTLLDYAECDAPIYHGDDTPVHPTHNPLPAGVQKLSDALHAHDGILLASPEYNWSIPGALKNLIDWLSIDPTAPLKSRSALLMCASPSIRGGILGLSQLNMPLSHLGVHVYPHLVAIGDAAGSISETALTNPKDAEFLKTCVTDFVRVANTSTRG